MAAPKGNQYAKGNKGGRPPTYDDAYIEKQAQLLEEWIDSEDNDDKVYIGAFAKDKPYPYLTMQEWPSKNEVFRKAWLKAKDWQLLNFMKKGLTKRWDPNFVQYVMARVCSNEWRKSWDAPKEENTDRNINVTIKKITKEKE